MFKNMIFMEKILYTSDLIYLNKPGYYTNLKKMREHFIY